MPKKNYEERKQEKIEAYEALAVKKAQESKQIMDQSQKMFEQIPMGQPMMPDHYSYNADKNFRNRAWNKIGKSIEVGKVADHYEHKAEAMKNNTAISSDDPKAIEKLNAKIESEKALHAKAKAKRKDYRDNKEKLIAELGDRVYHQRYYLLEAYMTGYLANIKRLKDRIKGLEAQESIAEEKVENNGISMEVNKEENRVMIFFPGKPDEEVRTKLKRHGFRWSPRNMAWQAYIKQWNIDFAKEIVQG